MLAEVGAERLEQASSLMEGQRAQRRTTDGAAIVKRGGHVDTRRGDACDLLAGYRVEHGPTVALRRYPGSGYVALQQRHCLLPARPRFSDRSFGTLSRCHPRWRGGT